MTNPAPAPQGPLQQAIEAPKSDLVHPAQAPSDRPKVREPQDRLDELAQFSANCIAAYNAEVEKERNRILAEIERLDRALPSPLPGESE